MSNNQAIEVNEPLVRKVADLARLALTDEEVALYSNQMKTTLVYVDQISKVDIPEGIEPLYHPLESAGVPTGTPMRKDVVLPSPKTADGKPKMIEPAPETLYEGFKVPPIIG
jgi:aspartyl-tRNA(Asn)/glutamyl-tRNA(Gln) amidotransferase subunit C